VDLAPTILGILGVTTPDEVRSRLQGRDLLAPQTVHPRLYAETLYTKEEFGWSALYALREGNLKYVAGPTPELFDLAADPAETSNRSDSRVDDARRLASALRVEAARLAAGRGQLAAAADLGKGPDAEAVARLESLGYGFFSDYLEKERRYDNARQVWLDLLATQPAFVGATTRLAHVEIAGGRAGDAARRLDAHVADHAEDASAWAQLGRARAGLGQREPALAAFERALALHPTEGAAVEGAVDLLLATGRRDDARRLVVRLEEKAPGDALLVRLSRDLR